jgi:hypothetical protein
MQGQLADTKRRGNKAATTPRRGEEPQLGTPKLTGKIHIDFLVYLCPLPTRGHVGLRPAQTFRAAAAGATNHM